MVYHIVETFEGENLYEFRDFTAVHEILGMPYPIYAISTTFYESFLREMLPSY